MCPQKTPDAQDTTLNFLHWYNQHSKDTLNSAVVWTLCGSQESKQNRKLEFFCFLFSLSVFPCTAFSVAPDMILPDYFSEDPITIFSYFVKARKFGNMVHGFLYPFLNLGLFCVHHIALFNVHNLSVFLHYFSTKENRDQRILTFLFKQFPSWSDHYRKDAKVEGMEHTFWYKDTFLFLPL